MLKNTQTTYGSVAKFLHWLIFILVLGMLVLGFFMGDINNKPLQGQVYNIHKLIGLSILAMMLFRAVWALTNPKPALPQNTPWWQHVAERGVHYSIYAALIVMPIAGWVQSAKYPPYLGKISLGLPVSPDNKLLHSIAKNTHYYVAFVIIALVSIHILAALYHEIIKKDNVLRRMLP